MRVCCARPGRINGAQLAFLGSVLLLLGLLALLMGKPERWFRSAPQGEPLVVYCAAGIKEPVEAAAREYEQTSGVPVRLQYGGSQTLLAGIAVSQRGDLYLPGDDSYLATARGQGLADEVLPLATMRPVLAVPRGNPKGLHSLDDLLRPGVRLSLARPDAAAVGKLTRAALEKAGRWEPFRARVVVERATVGDVANDVAVGAVDAGVVWDVTVRQYPALEAVRLAPLTGQTAHLAVGVLRCSEQPTAALRFARYLAARDAGLPGFATRGFDIIKGDSWEEEPELLLMAGAMLRPAVEQTIAAFERREGVKITRIYNGCGILVAQMKAGERKPDLYFACDQSFLTQVGGLFGPGQTISTNQLVILVPRGNPHGIHALDDLGKPGLRVGVGHEKQCAMGALTQETLRQGKARDRVMKNVQVQSPTGDMLVNQLLTGSLDAVIAYASNAAPAADRLEAVAIDIPCALAVQPVAVGKDSAHRHLAGRLVEAIRSRESRQRFEAIGFHWRAGE